MNDIRYQSYEDEIQSFLPVIIRKRFHIQTVTLIKEYYVNNPTEDKVVDKINALKQEHPGLRVYMTGFSRYAPYFMTTETQRLLLYKILINQYILIII